MTTRPSGARQCAARIRSRRHTDGAGSVFAAIREEKIDELAARIADSNPFATLDEEVFRQTVMGVTTRDKSFCHSQQQIESQARSARYSEQNNRYILDEISDAIALFSAREKLEFDSSGKIPTRFAVREIIVKSISEALVQMSPKERLAYQDLGAAIPPRIKIMPA